MTVHWSDLSRTELTPMSDTVVVMPTGAIEQHGPHLPTGTDAHVATALATWAVTAAQERGIRTVCAPALPFGASDHHLAHGGTLSLRAETFMLAVSDLLRALQRQGCRSVLIVNGHGGNSGPLAAVAAQASVDLGITIAHVDYWRLALGETTPAGASDLDQRWTPGHAGRFETALMRALGQRLGGDPPARSSDPDIPTVPGGVVHNTALWADIDGFTDSPASADDLVLGPWIDLMVGRLTEAIATLASPSGD